VGGADHGDHAIHGNLARRRRRRLLAKSRQRDGAREQRHE